MVNNKKYKLLFTFIFCSIWISSTLINSNALPSMSETPDRTSILPSLEMDDGFKKSISPSILANNRDFITNSVFNNHTFLDAIFKFLKSAQDVGSIKLPSMDTAYYIGSSLKILEANELIPPRYSDVIELMYNSIFEFVESTFNDNGGYSNWNGARSSIESTFQAISLYNTFNQIIDIPSDRVQSIIKFIDELKTHQGGYFPLLNWDVPDISSTYRSLWVKQTLNQYHPELKYTNNTGVYNYVVGNFNPSESITGASGYAEVTGGKTELLASLYAIKTFSMLNQTSPHLLNVTKYLSSLRSLNGGVSGLIGGLPTTGYTTSAIDLYLELLNYPSLDLNSIIPATFIDSTVNYVKGNKGILSGYKSSERDRTPELSSTFFALRMINNLDNSLLSSYVFDFSGLYDFIIQGKQPTFGIGDYPGDKGELSYTTMSILLSQLLDNNTWMNSKSHEYVLDSFDVKDSGFGFRPRASPKVKYTYYGVKALRSLSFPLVDAPAIRNFLLASRTIDGGFGQFPGAKLTYLSHTYWALTTLNLLGELDEDNINIEDTLFWLSFLKNNNGTYSNSRINDPSIISTYRALQVKSILGVSIETDPILNHNLSSYRLETGGYRNTLDKSYSTMEATYYGINLALKLNLDVNLTKTMEFILSLQNKDGGFGLRPGFTSRVTSTYFALLSLKILEQKFTMNKYLSEDTGNFDIYGPIIIPSFLPNIDTNQSIQGFFKTNAKIVDSENNVEKTWVEVSYFPEGNLIPQKTNYTGIKIETTSDLWTFILGPFESDGYAKFKIYATDQQNNTSGTEFYSILTLEIDRPKFESKTNVISLIIPLLPYFAFTIVGIEGIYTINKKKKTAGEIKMTFQNATQTNEYTETLHLVLIMFMISIMAFLARLLMSDALLILQNSIFLFRFLLAILVILMAKYVLGIQSYGLFAPSVLVVAFLSLGAFWGLIVFLNIFILLFAVRSLLSVFNLPVGFRIGILMVFAITYLGVYELVGEIFRIPFLSNTVFIPIIITPWIADRYVSDAQQNDHFHSAKKLSFTLIISLFAYLLMRNDRIVTFVAINPEIWIILVGGLIYFGRSRKYTRFDMKRFNRLFKNGSEPLSLLIRNREYITQYNSTVLYPIINKFNMKEQFDKWRVPTPELLGILSNEKELDAFINNINTNPAYANGFVIKPSQSFGGLGIVVVSKRVETNKFVVGGEIYHSNAIREECEKILQGEYLTSQTSSDRDLILIEQKITCHPKLTNISVGLPDIRVIIFRGVPIMAMARLPTLESGGKANLKQGAIGAAISIATGEITRAEWKTQKVTIHPDTNNKIIGYKFENWHQLLSIACLSQKASGLGYAGTDLILDEEGRPLVLEVNKRPGLEIQNINMHSLLDRMRYLEENEIDLSEKSPIHSARKGIDLTESVWEVL